MYDQNDSWDSTVVSEKELKQMLTKQPKVVSSPQPQLDKYIPAKIKITTKGNAEEW